MAWLRGPLPEYLRDVPGLETLKNYADSHPELGLDPTSFAPVSVGVGSLLRAGPKPDKTFMSGLSALLYGLRKKMAEAGGHVPPEAKWRIPLARKLRQTDDIDDEVTAYFLGWEDRSPTSGIQYPDFGNSPGAVGPVPERVFQTTPQRAKQLRDRIYNYIYDLYDFVH